MPMLGGTAAYDRVGIPERHGTAIQDVANRTGHLIMFRSVGAQCQRLLAEGYAAKGFRIDTKSCDWGPMQGFVCVDPRLSKVGHLRKKVEDNRHHTVDALRGYVRHDAVGGLGPEAFAPNAVLPDWRAGSKPVVISAERYDELRQAGLTGATNSAGIVKGVSTSKAGADQVRLPWALIPVARCMETPAFAGACGTPPIGGYGVFVDYDNPSVPFNQQRPGGAAPIKVLGYEAVLGLTNPDTQHYGYRACVTGDYDLFAVWAPTQALVQKGTLLGRPHVVSAAPQGPFGGRANVDARVVDQFKRAHPASTTAHHQQHYRLGNITPRLQTMKVWLNTALISVGGFTGGNLVHHSDEVGNPSPGLKKTLVESLPLIAFIPREAGMRAGLVLYALLIENTLHFKELVRLAQGAGIVPDLRPEWGNFASV